MKRIITIVFFVFLSGLCFSQNNQSGKALSDSDREKCNNNVEYLYQMAQKEYPEAEYLFALILHRDIIAEYSNFWAKNDVNNNFVAAAYYFKKACEHGWKEAFDLYADYCYYGRGGATGGLNEAIRWQEKAYESDPSNWTYAANLGSFYLSDDKQSNNEKGVELLFHVSEMPRVESAYYLFLGLAFYYGIVPLIQDQKLALSFFEKAIEAPDGRYDTDSKIIALYYLAYCSFYGIGIEKNEILSAEILSTIEDPYFDRIPTMSECIEKIQKYDLEYSNIENFGDYLFVLF